MKGKQWMWSLAGVAVLAMGMATAHAQQTATTRAVVALESSNPPVYEQRDDTFRRHGNLEDGQLVLPAPILAESGRGYVQVQTTHGPIWLDKMDVAIQPPLQPATSAACDKLSTASDTVVAMVRGAGEGCKR